MLYTLGSSKEIVFADETDSDDDLFAGFKKKGHKITFSDDDDDDDFSLSPKPSTSKGLKGSNDSKSSKGKIYSTFTSIRISILNCQFEFSCVFDLKLRSRRNDYLA